MKKSVKSYVLKILVLVSALALMLLLSGCRTRITNNTDVVGTVSDQSGMLQDSYQVRRDELGIPVAEPPLFTLFEPDEEDAGEDYEEYEDYSEEEEEYEEEEDFEEEEEEEEDTSTPATRPSTGTVTPIRRPGNYTPIRRPTVTPVTTVKVTLDPNGKNAKCNTTSILVRKDSTYGTLPTPTREGYEFKGWYTSKSKGNKVTSTTKVTTDKAHTLYAHWKEAEKPTYKITFDGNGEDDEVTLSSTEITVEEGGTYGDLPSAKREKHTFSGWFTEAEGGSQVTSGTKFTVNKDQTLYAHWEYDPYAWWNSEFETTANEIDSDSQQECIIDGGDDTEEDFMKDCKVSTADSDGEPAYIVKFIKNFDEEKAAEEADAVYEKYSESNPDATVIIVSDKALKGSKEQKLIYKMVMLETIYGNGGDIDTAESELLDGDSVSYPYVRYAESE